MIMIIESNKKHVLLDAKKRKRRIQIKQLC